jgi:hypothetical protein
MPVAIEVPGSAATLHDFHPPMIVVRRDCECKCDGSRQHHSAKDSTQKRASHLCPSVTLQSKLAFRSALPSCDLMRIHFDHGLHGSHGLEDDCAQLSGKITPNPFGVEVLNELKPGLDEKLYERAMIIELKPRA